MGSKHQDTKAPGHNLSYQRILIAAVCVLVPLCLGAQTDFSLIKGTVFTSDGSPITGAKVAIVRSDLAPREQKKSRKEATSDRLGEFAFRMDVGPAKFHLTVEAQGFAKQEKDVEVAGDERADISVVLKK
jgi:hypothetical protein